MMRSRPSLVGVFFLVAAPAIAAACSSTDNADPAADAGAADATLPRGQGQGTPSPAPDGTSYGTADSGPAAVDGASPTPSPAPGPDGSTPETAFRFVVFGDSRDNSDRHKAVVDAFAQQQPQLVLDTGDLWAGYGPNEWSTITMANANIADLVRKNLYLVSRGNHERLSELLSFKPTLVRNNAETYGFAAGNAYFVSVGMDPSKALPFLESELQKPEAQNAAWRFVYSHYPIYDSGDGHGADFSDGNPEVESLCDKYHVTAFFSGHEHIYERSHQMFARKVVDTANTLSASKGTLYVISGGGGAPFYSVTTPLPSSHITKTDVNHYVLVNTTTSKVTADVLDTQGNHLDQFEIDR